MHEAYIALGILDIAGEHSRKAGCRKVQSVKVRVGAASGVMPDALRFAFDASTPGTFADGAELIVEEVPLGGACGACGEEFKAEGAYVLSCPACGSPDISVNSGGELHIVEITAE